MNSFRVLSFVKFLMTASRETRLSNREKVLVFAAYWNWKGEEFGSQLRVDPYIDVESTFSSGQ